MWAEYKSTLKVSLCFLFFKFYNDVEDKIKFWIKKILGKNCKLKTCENMLKFCGLIFSPRRFLMYNLFALCMHKNFHWNWLNFSRIKINIQFVHYYTIKTIFMQLLKKEKFQYFFNLQNWILFLLLYALSYFQKLQ